MLFRSWDKCDPNDVKINAGDGDCEVVFTDSTKSSKVQEPQSEFKDVEVTIHYYRFNDDYDNWDLWSWVDEGENGPDCSRKFTATDDFGQVATYKMGELKANNGIGLRVRKDDWAQKDCEDNRFLNKTCINADGKIDAYIIQGDANVYYTKEEAKVAKAPNILSAKIDSMKEVSFKTTFNIPDGDAKDLISLRDSKGKEVEISDVSIADSKSGTVTAKENLQFDTDTYTLSIKGPMGDNVEQDLTLGKIFESEEFQDLYTYNGELGALYSADSTEFVIWAPTATKVQLALYGTDGKVVDNTANSKDDMIKSDNGTWKIKKTGDLAGNYYNYLVTVDGKANEVVDP